MKSVFYYIGLIGLAFFFNACELDNYDGPDAALSGGIYDSETKELIPQDIYQGSQIEYVEHGFDNPEIQYMIFKNDGTYQNKLMFANTYTIQPVRGNFVLVEAQDVEVKGDMKLDFYALPYIRIQQVKVERIGDKVVATFHLQQTVDNRIARIGLFAHPEPHLGANLYQVATIRELGGNADEKALYTLEIDLEANRSYLKDGESYYFRVGALIDAPEAKYNYAPLVRLTL